MGADGHVRLKRWYNPGYDREDYYDLSEYHVYWDSINKQYKAKFHCASCWKDIGWYCYDSFYGMIMIDELLDGMLCVECYQNENFDIDFEDCEHTLGRLCKC